MPDSRTELESALVNFREDILMALADLRTEIAALQEALQEPKPVTREKLDQLRRRAKEQHRGKYHQHYAEKIRSAHEVRD